MPPSGVPFRSTWRGFAASLLLPSIAAALQWLLWPYLSPFVWFFFFPATFYCSRLGRLPGIVATLFSCFLVWYLFLPPQLSWRLENAHNAFSVLVFIAMGALFTGTHYRLALAQAEIARALESIKASSTQRYIQTVLESAPIGFAVNTMDDGRAVFVSRNFRRIYGIDEDPVGTVDEFFEAVYRDPQVRAKIRQEVEAGIASGDPRRMRWEDVPVAGATGQQRFVTAVNIPIPDQNLIVSTVQDVTERKLAEELLRESEARFRAFVEQAADAIFVHDGSGKFIEVNNQACASLGYSRNELMNMGVCDLDPNFDLASPQPAWRQVQPGHPLTLQTEYRRKDGAAFPVEVRFGCFELKGEPMYVALVRDVSERESAQRDLLQSNLRLNLALASGQLGIWEWDIPADTIAWDDRMFELYGTLRGGSSVCYETWLDLLHAEDRVAAENAIAAALRDREPYSIEFRVVRPDGSLRHIKANGIVVRDSDGRPQRMIGINRDITDEKLADDERKKLSMQFLQAQKMESIGRLAGGVAHDFNNLLTVINGYSGMMLEQLRSGDPLADYAAEVQHAGKRAAALTAQLLAFSRKQVIRPQALNLNNVVTEAGRMLQRVIGEDIELVLRLAPDVPTIDADPNQIHQIILNLAVNARDAMPDGGRLEVETASVRLDRAAVAGKPDTVPGVYLQLTIRDNGTGISDEVREKLFEPFFTTKPQGRGTGLGLATVYGIVRQNRGWIDVESELGKGSAFLIYLPQASAEDEISGVKTEQTPALQGNETILVVEDEEPVRRLTANVLKRRGFRVLEACTGAEAKGVAAEHGGQIDLLLTDVVMPGISGRALAEAIRKAYPRMRVVLMSGYAEEIDVDRSAYVADAFLEKPFTATTLIQTIRQALG